MDITSALLEHKEKLGELFARTQKNLDQSTRAFLSQNTDLAKEVFESREDVKEEFSAFEENFVRIIALYQPVARDLRALMRSYKIGQDVERISSLVAKISKKTVKISDKMEVSVPKEFQTQVDFVQDMLKRSAQAVSSLDVGLCDQVSQDRGDAKQLKAVLKNKIEVLITDHPGDSSYLVSMLGVARHLDRIADLCSGICHEIMETEGKKLT